jgi:bacterial/archaeal transporter family protein
MLAQKWLLYALLSAVCAALVALFGKFGMKGVDSTLATFLRSVVMSMFLAGFCAFSGTFSTAQRPGGKALAMIGLAAVSGAASWLFYFKALETGRVSQVTPIDKLSVPLAVVLAALFLHERPSAINWLGVALVTAGALLVAHAPRA